MKLRIPVRILTAIFLCHLISCNGQVNNGSMNNAANSDSLSAKTQGSSQPMSLPDFRNQISETVRVMFQDSRGNYWFGTHSGVFKLVSDSLVYIDGLKSELGQRVGIRAIKEDINGKVWFGHTDGVSYINKDKIVNLYESNGLTGKDVWHLTPDSKGNIWIGTTKGVSKYDGRNFTHLPLPKGGIDSTVGVSTPEMIHNILEDSEGRMWFSTNAGLFIKDKNDLTGITVKEGLKSNFVGKVIETQDGDILICSSNLIYRYKDGDLTEASVGLVDEPNGAGNLTEAANGDIWFNCGRNIYRLSNNKLAKFRISEGDYGPQVYQIYIDRSERVWFVGWGGAFRFENGGIVNVTKNGPW